MQFKLTPEIERCLAQAQYDIMIMVKEEGTKRERKERKERMDKMRKGR